jgi:formamidopyrimidine-DNA glycosylase
MPELPELEVVCEVLRRRAVGRTIALVEAVLPGAAVVIRDLTGAGFAAGLTGASIRSVVRRGKFLVFTLEGPGSAQFLAVNPKLSGRLQLTEADDKRLPRTHVILSFAQGGQLRYLDQKQMGQIYMTPDLGAVPDLAGLGPEPFDLSLEEFRTRLRPFHGEIKGVLTRGECIAGIGNAYADEILWAARLHPYRKRTQLTPDETARLHQAMLATLAEAVAKVREEMGEDIHHEPRAFLSVHMKTGEPCPRCGTRISMVGANQRITNFCRTCQPGGLIKGMGQR